MEPSLKISENEYKPLSLCSRAETNKLHDHLIDKIDAARFLPHDTMYNQLSIMLTQVEERIALFDSGYLVDKAAKKRTQTRMSLIDDDDPNK